MCNIVKSIILAFTLCYSTLAHATPDFSGIVIIHVYLMLGLILSIIIFAIIINYLIKSKSLNAATNADITLVTVFDGNSNIIKVISSEQELNSFEDSWGSVTCAPPNKDINWNELYTLEISAYGKITQWLYHPDGWLMSAKNNDPGLYMLTRHEEINSLIDVRAKAYKNV